MRHVRAHMDYITAEISSDSDYENAIQFLITILGVKRDCAITIISEIGIDMSQFCKGFLFVSLSFIHEFDDLEDDDLGEEGFYFF